MQNSQKANLLKIEKKSSSKNISLVKTNILGVDVTSENEDSILEYIANSIKNYTKNYYIVTPNPEMIVLSHHSDKVRSILNAAKIALNDGVGVSLAAKVLGRPLKERITGVDFMVKVCKYANDWPITVGLLGGGPGVAEKTAERLLEKYPKLKITFAASDWSKESITKGEEHPVSRISDEAKRNDRAKENSIPNTKYYIPSTKDIDILFVAFGAPKQELWMAEHINKVPVRVMMGVGGAFDFISGNVKRAPNWVQNVGLEWLFRLLIEPWRWKRQLRLLEFIWILGKEKVGQLYGL